MTDRPRITVQTVVLDCSDAHEMAAFYGALLGWEPTFTEPNWVLMRNPEGGVGLSFQAEPDYVPPVWPQTSGGQRMMLHLDIRVDDLEAAGAFAVEAGATLADFQPQDDVRVFFDPAGHPFCLFLN
jgi:catechol 2,3-dioxygenase-like lactoylglutathione lyase family enzyme